MNIFWKCQGQPSKWLWGIGHHPCKIRLAVQTAAAPMCVDTTTRLSHRLPLPIYCSHISRLKDQKCQLLANTIIFHHTRISMRMNIQLLEERDESITCILS